MQITTFNPMILSKNADEIIKLFEELGFEKRHKKTGIDDSDISSVRMRYENEDGKVFHVDVADVAQLPQDMTTMRMNVRDFDEAYAFLKAHGFVNPRGTDESVDSPSSRSCLLVSPSGFSIQLTQHIRKEDRQ